MFRGLSRGQALLGRLLGSRSPIGVGDKLVTRNDSVVTVWSPELAPQQTIDFAGPVDTYAYRL